MTRSEIREEIFRMLFQAEFHDHEDLPVIVERSLDEENSFPEPEDRSTISSEDMDEIEAKVKDISGRINDLDSEINEVSESWKTSRMNKVDLTLIRLALYEMEHDGLEPGIAINEAVELAKRYGTAESGKFVNGVLGGLARRKQ